MAKISAKNCQILVDNSSGSPVDLSSDCKSFEIEYSVDPLEVTAFGAGSKNFIPGLKSTGVTLDFFWNSASSTGAFDVIKGIVGLATSVTVTIKPEGSGTTFSGEFMCDGIAPKGEPTGTLELGSVHFSPMGTTAASWS